MKATGRYASNSSEGEFQPNSNDLVLKNKLGITGLTEMEALETEKFTELSNNIIQSFAQDQSITVADILSMHKQWLSSIYSWAGEYRSVNMAKGGFLFAAAHLLPKLVSGFEKQVLSKYTPCLFDSQDAIVEALAVVHVEFVLIHPFREGNGRVARLISTIMALQAGLPMIDFSSIKNERQEEYFAAVRSGLGCDYSPMKIIFRDLLYAQR